MGWGSVLQNACLQCSVKSMTVSVLIHICLAFLWAHFYHKNVLLYRKIAYNQQSRGSLSSTAVGIHFPIYVPSHSVMSNSLWPHGLQPHRLLCPWDSTGKNTGMGCHFLLQGIFLTQNQINVSCISYIDRWILYHSATWEALPTCSICLFLCVFLANL